MALPPTPPTRTEAGAPLKLGSTGWPVYALQKALQDGAGFSLSADGVFGPRTDEVVRAYQTRVGVTSDGIAGPTTKRLLSEAICRRLDREFPDLPNGLMLELSKLESGSNPGAVNPDVPGGADCGLFQKRVYEPYSVDALKSAYSPYDSGVWSASDPDHGFLPRVARFSGAPYTWSRVSKSRAQRCALLAHNWPAGAETYAKSGNCSYPTSEATWVTRNADGSQRYVYFLDGERVFSRADWCLFYAMGSPQHCGPVPAAVGWGT